MNNQLLEIQNCTDANKRFELTIEYIRNEGVQLRQQQNDYLNHRYWILENGSSIWVYGDHFKMNLCDGDKDSVEKALGLEFRPNYKAPQKDMKVDPPRPWTCEFVEVEILEKIVQIILGKTVGETMGINVARNPNGYADGKWICPNCEYGFEKAPRCPECGQLIKYESDVNSSELT